MSWSMEAEATQPREGNAKGPVRGRGV